MPVLLQAPTFHTQSVKCPDSVRTRGSPTGRRLSTSYLAGTKNHGICFPDGNTLLEFGESNKAGKTNTRRSTLRLFFMTNNGSVSVYIAQSTTEAKLIHVAQRGLKRSCMVKPTDGRSELSTVQTHATLLRQSKCHSIGEQPGTTQKDQTNRS